MGIKSVLDTKWATQEEGVPRVADTRREGLRALVRRSALFVPVNVPKFVEKAHVRGADAIILDLEDSVPISAKHEAREVIRDSMDKCSRGGADILVRINHPYSMAAEDLKSCVWPGLNCVMFPKAESPREIEILDHMLGELEAKRGIPLGSVQLWIIIESALGLHNALPIALASSRTVSIGLGAEDFTLDIGVEPSRDGRELFYGKSQVILVARIAGLQPVGTMASMADYRDSERMMSIVREARQMGFMGSSCIHPAQVEPLNKFFSPSADELAHAHRVIEALKQATDEGRASVGVDGKMVDVPVAERAKRLIARANAIEAKEQRKREATTQS